MKKKLRKQLFNHYKWWDSVFLLEMMEDWLRHSAKMHETRGHLLCSDRTALEMKIVAELLKRVHEDEIYDEPNKVFRGKNKYYRENMFGLETEAFAVSKDADKRRKADLKYTLEIFEKKLFGWWD